MAPRDLTLSCCHQPSSYLSLVIVTMKTHVGTAWMKGDAYGVMMHDDVRRVHSHARVELRHDRHVRIDGIQPVP